MKGSQEEKAMPYPDDLDDTFCALSALYRYDKKIIDGKALANVVNLLTATEIKIGGPYRTWLVEEKSLPIWKDVDLAVNSNIAYFLSLIDISLPNINSFVELHIKKAHYISSYYPSLNPIIYFISRFYKGKHLEKMQAFLLDRRNEKHIWGNPLETALCISSLINTGVSEEIIRPGIEYLVKTQRNGIWKPYPFCLNLTKGRRTYFAGSSVLTTAFCLEALAKYVSVSFQKPLSSIKEKGKELIYKKIVENIKRRLSTLDPSLQKEANKVFSATLKRDVQKKQISLLPYFFKESLGERGGNVSSDFLIKLGQANLYGWMAYTIYDNFLDNEGDQITLSTANLCLRELTIIFENILPDTNFSYFFQYIMDKTDNANTWETTYCRIKISDGILYLKNFTIPDYGDFGKLADRSIGHALGPAAILYSLGYVNKSPEFKNVLNFFKHYIIARQLNDDAHDWEKDLRAGNINPITSILLAKSSVKDHQNLKKLIPKLQHLFWYETINEIHTLVFEHTRLAREALATCSLIADSSFFERLLQKYEKSVQIALEEKNNTIKFLDHYQK